MPLTTLEKTPALVVIDLQQGIAAAAGQAAQGFAEVVAHSAQLARAFRARQLPVVLVNVAGRAPGRTDAGAPKLNLPPGWTDLLPELEPHPSDYRVTKERVGAFIGTPLDEVLRGKGVTQVILTGVATSAGVESTARSAHDLGYHVVLVADAMTDLRPEAHRHSIEMVFPRLGEVTSTPEVLAKLQTDS
jgi:nicotinamidase-related amidase